MKHASLDALRLCGTLFFALLYALGCDKPVAPRDTDPLDGTVGRVTISAQHVAAAAAAVYDAVESRTSDPTDMIRQVVRHLNLYPREGTHSQPLQWYRDEGVPVFAEDMIRAMGTGYRDGILVSLESFIESMGEWGVRMRASQALIIQNNLTDFFAPFADQEELGVTEVIPALILRLGHERASRDPMTHVVHPVWADHMLDPLQFALLSYALLLSGNSPTASLARKASPAITARHSVSFETWYQALATLADYVETGAINVSRIRGMVTGEISRIVGIPLTADEAVSAVIAASTVLYSYTFALDADHTSLTCRWPENPAGSEPHRARLSATLNFDFVPHDPGIMLALTVFYGQSLPQNGPVREKPIFWKMDGDLAAYGGLEVDHEMTNSAGEARAVYQCNDEKTPVYLRSSELAKAAHGAITAHVTQLLPHKWRTLAALARMVREVGQDSRAITVRYYEPPDIQVRFTTRYGFDIFQGDVLNVHYHGTIPLTLADNQTHYSGSAALHNETGFTPSCAESQLLSKTHGTVSVILTISSSATEPRMVVSAFANPPREQIYLVNCRAPDDPPRTIPTSGWLPFTGLSDLTPQGFTSIPGPWQRGGSSFGALYYTETTVPVEMTDGVYVKAEILRR